MVADKVMFWDYAEKDVGRIYWNDFGREMGVGGRLNFGHGLRAQSRINQVDNSFRSWVEYKHAMMGKGRIGLNTPGRNIGVSGYANWAIPLGPLVPTGSSHSLRFRANKGFWRSQPYFGVDLKQQWSYVALTTSLGHNPGTKLLETPPNETPNTDFDVRQTLTIGDQECSVGGELVTNVKTSAILDFNARVDWRQKNQGIGLRTFNRSTGLQAHLWRDIDPTLRIGFMHTYYLNQRAHSALLFQFRPPKNEDKLRLGLKIDTSGLLQAAINIQEKEGRMHLCAGIDTHTGQPSASVGLTLGDF